MPEIEYEAFLKYGEMKDKYDYMQEWGVETKTDVAKTLAVFGGSLRLTTICKFRYFNELPKV